MDLRPYLRDPAMLKKASELLRYQPYILSDDLQTGVGYSWVYGQQGGNVSGPHEWICDRRTATPEQWSRFTDAGTRLRTMYEDWLEAISSRFPGGSLADIGCNSGYFPVRAQLLGMRGCAGYDNPGFAPAFEVLNRATRAGATFHGTMYDFYTHTLPGCAPASFDVACASVVFCHLPDPLYFLACLGKIARKGVFLFTGMGDSDGYTVHYQEPNFFRPHDPLPFPHGFDLGTGLSRGLLYKSMEWMGFKECVEVPYRESWLPRKVFAHNLKALLFLR
jgi:SAM-dependent methyltransferase